MAPTSEIKVMCRPFWDEVAALNSVARIWRRDHSLWNPDPAEIRNRLGWLDLPESMRPAVTELVEFGVEAKEEGFRHVVLLGMGGSSLCAEVLRRAIGSREGFPQMIVLDSTVPDTIKRVTQMIDPMRTIFVVSSKSGGTIEVNSLYKHFRRLVDKVRLQDAGDNFIAITDKETSLERLSVEGRFRYAFINPSNIGGRYSALSYFGLVPAALMGLDIGEMLTRGREMARACGVTAPTEENPGAWLGTVAGCMARTGRDKLTILSSPKLESFGLWAEQLVAESTGKKGKGIVPIVEEPLGSVETYGPDRLFVHLRLANDANEATDNLVKELESAGQPVLHIELKDLYDIGGEFFRWEFATAVAGACLEINPFDQPNVQESKDNTRRVLQAFSEKRSLPELKSEGSFADILNSAQKGAYVALMAFSDETPELEKAVRELRAALLRVKHLPTTFGYGPRFLHSTGQLHKGGAGNGIFIQLTSQSDNSYIPGEQYGFSILASAQAIGDFESLKAYGCRVIRIHGRDSADLAAQLGNLAETL